MLENTIHHIKDCEFIYKDDTGSRKIYTQLYTQHKHEKRFEQVQFHFDLGASLTCMSLTDINPLMGYDIYDIDYTNMVLCSGYEQGRVLCAVPIIIPHIVVGGFVLQNVRLFTNLKLEPTSISLNEIEKFNPSAREYVKKIVRKDILSEFDDLRDASGATFDNSIVDAMVDARIDDYQTDIYNHAFMLFYNSKIISKSSAGTSSEQARNTSRVNYSELLKHFDITVPSIARLLGMDILHYFDIIVAQPRYQLINNRQPVIRNGKLLSTGDDSFIKGDLISKGNLYFSIPDSVLYKSTRLSQESGYDYSIGKIENIDAEELVHSYFNNSKDYNLTDNNHYRVSSDDDIMKVLSQNCQIIHNEYGTFNTDIAEIATAESNNNQNMDNIVQNNNTTDNHPIQDTVGITNTPDIKSPQSNTRVISAPIFGENLGLIDGMQKKDTQDKNTNK